MRVAQDKDTRKFLLGFLVLYSSKFSEWWVKVNRNQSIKGLLLSLYSIGQELSSRRWRGSDLSSFWLNIREGYER